MDLWVSHLIDGWGEIGGVLGCLRGCVEMGRFKKNRSRRARKGVCCAGFCVIAGWGRFGGILAWILGQGRGYKCRVFWGMVGGGFGGVDSFE